MTAQNPDEENPTVGGALPKEPLDLPREPLDLPKEPLDLPSGTAQNETHKHPHAPAHPHHKTEHPHNIKTILEWTAPGRPFRKRGRQYYLTSLLIMLLVEVILFLFSQYMLMLVVLAFVFVAFALNTIAPSNFRYRISTEGITVEDHFFLWQELYDFYFKKREGVDVAHIRTHAFLPGELTLTLGETDREYLKSALLPYLPYREFVKPTFMDKSADWLTKNFPLEKSPDQK